MRAGGTAAKRGSLATHSTSARSASLRAWLLGHRARGLRPAIALYGPPVGLPALQGAFVDPRDATGQAQPCAGAVGRFDVMSQTR